MDEKSEGYAIRWSDDKVYGLSNQRFWGYALQNWNLFQAKSLNATPMEYARGLAHAMMSYYCPVFAFDSRERYFPISIENYLQGCEMFYKGNRILPRGSVTTKSLLEQTPPHLETPKDRYSDLRLNTVPNRLNFCLVPHRDVVHGCPGKLLNRNSPVYCDVRLNLRKQVYIFTYVQFYAFNGSGTILCCLEVGAHTADLERVEVHVSIVDGSIVAMKPGAHGSQETGNATSLESIDVIGGERANLLYDRVVTLLQIKKWVSSTIFACSCESKRSEATWWCDCMWLAWEQTHWSTEKCTALFREFHEAVARGVKCPSHIECPQCRERWSPSTERKHLDPSTSPLYLLRYLTGLTKNSQCGGCFRARSVLALNLVALRMFEQMNEVLGRHVVVPELRNPVSWRRSGYPLGDTMRLFSMPSSSQRRSCYLLSREIINAAFPRSALPRVPDHGRPVVYVACGGHGTYVRRGDFRRAATCYFYKERVNGRGILWNPQGVVPIMPDPVWQRRYQTQWVFYSGKLGDDGVGGPLVQFWWRASHDGEDDDSSLV